MPEKKGRVGMILRDTSVTLFTEILVLLSFFIFFRLLLEYFGAENLGLYALAKRVIAMLLPLLLLGLNDGMARFLAMTTDIGEKYLIMIVGLISVVTTGALAATAFNFDKEASAVMLFGNTDYIPLITPFTVLLIGLVMHVYSYSVLRGIMRIWVLNIFQIINLAALPVVLIVVYQKDFASLVLGIGVAQGVIALVPLIVLTRIGPRHIPWNKTGEMARKLYYYSIPRILNGVVIGGLMALGPFLAKNYMSMTEVGYLALSFSLLMGVASFVSPLGIVLLPHLSKMISMKQLNLIGEKVHLLIGAVVQMFLFICIQFLVFADYLVKIWMGPDYGASVPVISIVFVSVFFYGFFISTKSILDAISVKPINTINVCITLVVLLVASYVGPALIKVDNMSIVFASAFTASMGVLGGLTYVSLRRLLPGQVTRDVKHLFWGILLSLLLGGVAVYIRPFVIGNLGLFIVTEMLLSMVYIWLLSRLRFGWVMLIWRHLPFTTRTSAA